MKIPSESELLQAGVHFGHKPSSWHPRMSDFIFGQKNNVHIIDLEKTRTRLEAALKFIEAQVTAGGQILFVGTKVQAQTITKKYATACEMPYVNEKWLGGTLTNFRVINSLVKKIERLEKQKNEADYAAKYTKKERHEFDIEIKLLEKMIAGIRNLKQIPAVLFLLSAREEKTAIKEAIKKKVPIVAICDTNVNPDRIDYPIPGNDDAIKSLDLITSLVTQAVQAGQQKIVANSIPHSEPESEPKK